MPSNQLAALMSCGCCTSGICCPNRTCPDDGLPSSLPTSLTVELTASFPNPGVITPSTGHSFTAPDPSDCFDFSFQVYLIECRGLSGAITYAGQGEHTCTWCGNTYTMQFNVVITCAVADGGWLLTVEAPSPSGDCDLPGDVYRTTFSQSSCDPILLVGDMDGCFTCSFLTCTIGGIMIPPGIIVPVIATHPAFCLAVTVYESP